MFKYGLAVILLLSGCAHTQKSVQSSVNIGEDAQLNLKEPKDIFPEIEMVQVLTIEHGKEKRTSQVVLSSLNNKLTIVALLPFGGEVFRVEYAEGVISAKSLPMVQKNFDLKYALSDIVMIYAEKEKLETWLSKGVEVIDTEMGRTIRYKGQDLISIQYDQKDRWTASVKYEHLLRKYKIQVQSVSVERHP